MTNRQILYKLLRKICATYPEQFKIKIDFTTHFLDRMAERYEGNFFKGAMELVECLDKNICLIVYYLNIDGVLPFRGAIQFGKYEVRGNVMNGDFVLTTFIN